MPSRYVFRRRTRKRNLSRSLLLRATFSSLRSAHSEVDRRFMRHSPQHKVRGDARQMCPSKGGRHRRECSCGRNGRGFVESALFERRRVASFVSVKRYPGRQRRRLARSWSRPATSETGRLRAFYVLNARTCDGRREFHDSRCGLRRRQDCHETGCAGSTSLALWLSIGRYFERYFRIFFNVLFVLAAAVGAGADYEVDIIVDDSGAPATE